VIVEQNHDRVAAGVGLRKVRRTIAVEVGADERPRAGPRPVNRSGRT
jgi:hypothetical protein